MIAAATFVISADESHWFEKVVIGSEIIAYLFLALCCLRCLFYRDLVPASVTLSGEGPEAYKNLVREDVIRHGFLLNFAVRWTFAITFIFALSLAAPLIL
jgi:hypothetical protein